MLAGRCSFSTCWRKWIFCNIHIFPLPIFHLLRTLKTVLLCCHAADIPYVQQLPTSGMETRSWGSNCYPLKGTRGATFSSPPATRTRQRAQNTAQPRSQQAVQTRLGCRGILGKLKTAWILVEFSLFPCRREQDKFRRPYGNLWTAAGNTCVWAVVKCWKAKHENWNHAGPNKEKLLSLNHTPGCLVFMGCYSHLVYWYCFTHDEDFRSAIKALSST